MNRFSRSLVQTWTSMGSRFLPFADAATPDLPLSRLLRLSLFQISVGMALVLLIGTLNRVMIVELKVPASIVSIMVALPIVFAPLRALIGFKSDIHRSELGWRRVPFLWMGTMLQFGGFAVMPFALLVLAGAGQAANAPIWVGHLGAAIAFLLVGAGLHTVQTVGLALATDLVPQESQPKVVGLMYVTLLVGMVVSALAFGALLGDYSPGRLIQVIQGAAVLTIVLNVTAMWKQEARDRNRKRSAIPDPSFMDSWRTFSQGPAALRRLAVVGLGTMAFTMEDVLLEPYGGEVLGLSVSATTLLTATLAFGSLIGFWFASRVLGRGADPYRMAGMGALVGMPAFVAVIAAAPIQSAPLFTAGTFLIGLGAGLFSHGTLTATMQSAPKEQVGLALGAWGAVQATAAGLAMAIGGVARDLVVAFGNTGSFLGREFAGAATGYVVVYIIEVILLMATLVCMAPLVKKRNARESTQ
ncbi:MAG: MFS transporter [Betaproteobacteria bacterium]|nr:MFS transporter [Betaproteobacteria bacterium]